MTEKVTEDIVKDLGSAGDSQKAEDMARYLKTSSLEFWGVKLPQIHKITRKHIKGIEGDDLLTIARELWEKKTFDTRRAAINVLERYIKHGNPEVALDLASIWIDDVDTWALMDPLGSNCLGGIIKTWPELEEKIAEWQTSDNFWRRRATILPYLQLSLKRNYTPEYKGRILAALVPHLSDDEFFVAKAVGWVLRELSKREPDVVRDFIDKNQDKMSKLAIREGSKKLK